MTRTAAALLVAVACVLATAASSGAASPRMVTVRLVLVDRLHARPIEGYVWYAGPAGHVQAHVPGAAATVRIPAGTRTLVGYIRTCDGNCGYLDAPSHRCSRIVRIVAGRIRTATFVLRDSGCTIQLR